MLPRFEGRDLDAKERKCIDDVEKFGWQVVNIREEKGHAGWAFTVGLYENFRHPEVVLFGLREESRHPILNWIGENVREKQSFAVEQEHNWVLEGSPCWSRSVQRMWYRDLLGWATWFYGSTAFPAVQCIWPTREGIYPWDEKCAYSNPQPLLYESEIAAARMIHFVKAEALDGVAWPFPNDPHQGVFISRCVFEEGAPIVRVFHDRDDDWQFIGPVEDPEADGCKLSCFHCVLERDATIRRLGALPKGWEAWRDDTRSAWQTRETPPKQDI